MAVLCSQMVHNRHALSEPRRPRAEEESPISGGINEAEDSQGHCIKKLRARCRGGRGVAVRVFTRSLEKAREYRDEDQPSKRRGF